MITALIEGVHAHLGTPVGSHFRCCGVLRNRPDHAAHIVAATLGSFSPPTRREIPAQMRPAG